ncbi:hypothetical protein [Sphingomonas sp. NFX23]|uniref:hypothetical protein n=1 Tax=Sphingomonas sp. NFX23 TaxID=2819532 RepID=UPI003CF7FE04
MNATLPGAAAHSVHGAPVTTIAELDTLDSDEMLEGYRDGRAGELEPGGNRSRSYWHGWRNGTVDGGHQSKDDAQAALAAAVHHNSSKKDNAE